MKAPVITFEGYALYEWGNGYKSEFEDGWHKFDTAAQWVQYVKLVKGIK